MFTFILIGAVGMAVVYRLALAYGNTGSQDSKRAKLVQLLGGGGPGVRQ